MAMKINNAYLLACNILTVHIYKILINAIANCTKVGLNSIDANSKLLKIKYSSLFDKNTFLVLRGISTTMSDQDNK